MSFLRACGKLLSKHNFPHARRNRYLSLREINKIRNIKSTKMSSEFPLSLPLSDLYPLSVQEEIMQDLTGDDMAFNLSDLNESGTLIVTNDEDQDYLLECKQNFQDQSLLGNQNETLNVQTTLALTSILSNEEYSGPFEFEVGIHPNANAKHSWEYSTCLNKIYMKMLSPFPVEFKTKTRPDWQLYIRVTPQYSQPDHSQEFVHRCLHHEHPTEKSNHNLPGHIHPHILRCSSSTEVLYVGQKGTNERLSLLLPFMLPQTGADNVREIFQFVCNSSCPEPGVNRRLLEVIFTLEDVRQQIFGRKSINVRICSCPKRDKEKDEKDSLASTATKPGKKRKLDKTEKQSTSSKNNSSCSAQGSDATHHTLNFKICGKHNYQQVLKYCADLMSGEVLRNKPHGTEMPYVQSLQEINALMKSRYQDVTFIQALYELYS